MAKKDDEANTGDPGAPMTDRDLMIRLTLALEGLNKQKAETPSEGSRVDALIQSLAPALARLAEAQVEGSKLIADETRRAHRPSNEVVPQVSVFNRRGNMLPDSATGPRKPPLYAICLLPWLVEWESITREEAELLNLLIAAGSGDYVIKRIDNSKVKVEVKVDYRLDNVTPYRLLMNHDTAFNNDNFRLMPAMSDLLRQLLKQAGGAVPSQAHLEVRRAAAQVLSDEEEEALIEAGELTVSV